MLREASMDPSTSVIIILLPFLIFGVSTGRRTPRNWSFTENEEKASGFMDGGDCLAKTKIQSTKHAKEILLATNNVVFAYLDSMKFVAACKSGANVESKQTASMHTVMTKVVRRFLFATIAVLVLLIGVFMASLHMSVLSLSIHDMKVLQETAVVPNDKGNVVIGILKRRHQLIIALVICEAAAMEVFSFCLNKIGHIPFWIDYLLYLIIVLFVERVIPQVMGKRHKVAMVSNSVQVAHILMMLMYPFSSSIGKFMDHFLDEERMFYSRNELKVIFSMHDKEARNGGDLMMSEVAEVYGVFKSMEKTAETVMKSIPREALLFNLNEKEMLEVMIANKCAGALVYKEHRSDIVGYIDVENIIATACHGVFINRSISDIIHQRVGQNDSLRDVLDCLKRENASFATVMPTLPQGADEQSQEPLGVISRVDVMKEIFKVEICKNGYSCIFLGIAP